MPDQQAQEQASGLSRRRFLGVLGAGSALAFWGSGSANAKKATSVGKTFDATTVPVNGVFSLPPLPYDYAALEPYIDAETMFIHLQKHHKAFIDNLNTLVKNNEVLLNRSIAELLSNLSSLPAAIQTAVRNNGGGHANHAIFWATMAPDAGGKPVGKLATMINETFGSYDSLKSQMSAAAITRFGSGWAWLSTDASGALKLASYPNQDSPYMDGLTPLLGVDVWEHAYYLKYRQKRPEYLAAWWNTVNWGEVGRRYDLVMAK